MAVASCKYTDCAGEITVPDVSKVTAIPKAPHHLALVAQCGTCQRTSQYVVERTTWEDAREKIKTAAEIEADYVGRAIKAAEIELDAIETVNDLINLWASYKTPPLLEGLEGRCHCAECEKRRYG